VLFAESHTSMFKNYIKTAWRNITRQKVFSFVNISGLALSLTTIWLIALFIADELSFDRYHEKAGRIYRLATHGKWGDEKFDITGTSGLAAEAFKKDFPEVEDAVRILPAGGGVVDYENKKIKDDAIFFADPSFFTAFTYRFLAGNEHALEKPNSIILTKTLATKLFSAPHTALDKTLHIDNTPCIVTGVIEDVPHNSNFSFSAIRAFPADYKGDWGGLNFFTYILLKKKSNIKQLRAKMR
jgi:putative ABC transport system permease protein